MSLRMSLFCLALWAALGSSKAFATTPAADIATLTAQIESKKAAITAKEEEIARIQKEISAMGYPNPFSGLAEINRFQSQFDSLQLQQSTARYHLSSLRADLIGLQGDLHLATRPEFDMASLSCGTPDERAARDAFRAQHWLPPLDHRCQHDVSLLDDERHTSASPEVRAAAEELLRSDCAVMMTAVNAHNQAVAKWQAGYHSMFPSMPYQLEAPITCRLLIQGPMVGSMTTPHPAINPPLFVPESVSSASFPAATPSWGTYSAPRDTSHCYANCITCKQDPPSYGGEIDQEARNVRLAACEAQFERCIGQ